MDSDDEGGFSWLKWLNPQDGKSYVRARASANAAAVDFKRNNNQKASDKIALASFGKRGRGDFNLWSDDDEQASDSSASTASNASRLPPCPSDNASRRPRASNASNASISSRTPTPSNASSSSHTPTPPNASRVSMDSLPYAT